MQHALARLYALGPGRMEPGRDRLCRLLKQAGDPHLAVPSVLVGGTNGKGRVVAGLSACLSTGYRTGAFLKPHLVSITERWRIDDRPVAESAFIGAVHQACDLIEEHGEAISFFEANVLVGALLFRDAGCHIAVWEVGLGGREDACNLLDPLLSIIANVGYDHQQYLGTTLAEIAADKAHIARAGRPLLLGAPRPGWEAAYAEYAPVIERVCRELGACLCPSRPAIAELWNMWCAGTLGPVPLDALDLIQRALAILAKTGFELDQQQSMQALRTMRYRGRLEATRLDGAPVLLDAAHNVDSLRWLAQVLVARAGCPT